MILWWLAAGLMIGLITGLAGSRPSKPTPMTALARASLWTLVARTATADPPTTSTWLNPRNVLIRVSVLLLIGCMISPLFGAPNWTGVLLPILIVGSFTGGAFVHSPEGTMKAHVLRSILLVLLFVITALASATLPLPGKILEVSASILLLVSISVVCAGFGWVFCSPRRPEPATPRPR